MEHLDHTLFRWINEGLSNPVFDVLCFLFREKMFWSPLYFFVAVFLFLNFGKKGWPVVLALVFAVALADQTSSQVIKKTVKRLRPCNQIELAEHLVRRVNCGGGFSFPSSHAANHFAAAVFLSGFFGQFFRRARWWFLGWAAAVSFSQVYVGVHFPSDVLAGGFLGAGIGWAVLQIFRNYGKNLGSLEHYLFVVENGD